MGLAASQGRLLLLTARKTDLEYRAQQITQRKLILAANQETIADTYNKALNNRLLQVKNGDNWTSVTYQNLLNANQLLVWNNTANGGNPSEPVAGADNLSADEVEQGLRDGTFITRSVQTELKSGSSTDYTYSVYPSGSTDANGNNIAGTPMFNDTNENAGWQQNSSFQDILNTSDDNPAEANYDYQLARTESEDKILDSELKQIETEQKAVDTEIDSVKKVIQGNIEKSFKTFA